MAGLDASHALAPSVAAPINDKRLPVRMLASACSFVYKQQHLPRAATLPVAAGWDPEASPTAGIPRYDIAAIKLAEPIEGANWASLVGPDSDLGASGLDLQIAGFGETETAFISKVCSHAKRAHVCTPPCTCWRAVLHGAKSAPCNAKHGVLAAAGMAIKPPSAHAALACHFEPPGHRSPLAQPVCSII